MAETPTLPTKDIEYARTCCPFSKVPLLVILALELLFDRSDCFRVSCALPHREEVVEAIYPTVFVSHTGCGRVIAICVIPSELLAKLSTADRNQSRNSERIRLPGLGRLPEKFAIGRKMLNAPPICKVPRGFQPHPEPATRVC
jgi:hypothetical protein